jgi:hypothetical protein
MTDKKWYILQPVYGGKWGVPDKNTPWSNDCNIALGRLLQAGGNHFSNDDIDMTADIYYMIIFNTDHYEKELEVIRKLRAKGSKVILTFSADMRFLTGEGLLGSTGINYTDICAEADLIISAVPDHIKLYGRYQYKVISMGVFLERLNFSSINDIKDIDITTDLFDILQCINGNGYTNIYMPIHDTLCYLLDYEQNLETFMKKLQTMKLHKEDITYRLLFRTTWHNNNKTAEKWLQKYL